MGHYVPDSKIPKISKDSGKALVISNADRMDSSDSEEEVNYTLMANVEDGSQSSETVPNIVYDFDTDNMSKLKSFLRSLHISYRSQSQENSRIISEKTELKKRNDQLEAELIFMIEIQKECDKAKHKEKILTVKLESLEKELEKKEEKIRV